MSKGSCSMCHLHQLHQLSHPEIPGRWSSTAAQNLAVLRDSATCRGCCLSGNRDWWVVTHDQHEPHMVLDKSWPPTDLKLPLEGEPRPLKIWPLCEIRPLVGADFSAGIGIGGW